MLCCAVSFPGSDEMFGAPSKIAVGSEVVANAVVTAAYTLAVELRTYYGSHHPHRAIVKYEYRKLILHNIHGNAPKIVFNTVVEVSANRTINETIAPFNGVQMLG